MDRRKFLLVSSSIATSTVLSGYAMNANGAEKIEGVWRKAKGGKFDQRFAAGHEGDESPLYISQTIHALDTSSELKKLGANVEEVFKKFDSAYDFGMLNKDGSVLQAPSKAAKIVDSVWHLGKAGNHLSDGSKYSFDDEEHNAADFFVFAPADPDRYEWVKAADGAFPEGAIMGWNTGEQQVIARANFDGGVHPGKLVVKSKLCFIGWGGDEYTDANYEVLRRKP